MVLAVEAFSFPLELDASFLVPLSLNKEKTIISPKCAMNEVRPKLSTCSIIDRDNRGQTRDTIPKHRGTR